MSTLTNGLDIEVWKDIKDYEGHYQVSNHGRVRSLDRTVEHSGNARKLSGKIMSFKSISAIPGRATGGHLSVNLSMDGVKATFMVQRLVAMAFLSPPERDDFVVTRIVEDRGNNRADNLRWGPRGDWATRLAKRIFTPDIHVAIEHLFTKGMGVKAIANELCLPESGLAEYCCKTRLSASPSKGGIKEEKETWYDLPGFETRYQYSSLGRVKKLEVEHMQGDSAAKCRERLLKVIRDSYGTYYLLRTRVNGVLVTRRLNTKTVAEYLSAGEHHT